MPRDDHPRSENLPAEIGGYAIQRVLGTGGMATVYAALQARPRRTVALKVMRGAANTPNAMRRFRREIEILGKLRHPYIAQVFDAGVHEDHGGSVPWFVMEYVPRAKTITAFAEAAELSMRHRLKMFVKVCAAVEHGHRRKIIHRDLKPGNILIDETGDPKVIDFGIARAMELDASTQTVHTEEGRLVGTVQYMAPEQLEATRQDLDARCDVYALGGVLYRLLTGRAPHDLTGLPVYTAAQVVREDQPSRPSSIRPELKGDLDTIILRALAKDRARRYPTAGSLGRDIVRYLAHKPIKARKVTRAHRLRLFVRRHPAETRAAIVVGAIALVAGGVIVGQQAALNRRAAPPPGGDGVAVDSSSAVPAGAAPGPDDGPSDPAGRPAAGPPAAAAAGPDLPDPFVLARGTDAVTALAFDAAGRTLAVASARPAITWWDLDARDALLTTSDHEAPATHLAFARDGATLVSLTADGEVVVVDRAGPATTIRLRRRVPTARALAVSPDAARIAVACDDLTLRLLATAPGVEPLTLRGTRGAFGTVAFSADGALLAGGSTGGGVSLWHAADGRPARALPPFDDAVIGVVLAPGHLTAITAGGTARTWPLDADDAAPSTFVTDVAPLLGAVFAPSREWVACRAENGVQVIALPDGRALPGLIDPAIDAATGLAALAPDARWYATGALDGAVTVTPVAARW